jgi:hypothetical protein
LELPVIQVDEEVPVVDIKTTVKWFKLGEVVTALALARKGFDPVKKNADNPFYKDAKGKARKYADLSEMIGATADTLAEQGLEVLQFPSIDYDNQTVGITTILAHSSSGYIMSTMVGCPAIQKTDKGVRFEAQTIGIGFTYLARYSYRAILNLGTDDDDGNGLVSSDKPEPKRFSPQHTLTGLQAGDIRSPLSEQAIKTQTTVVPADSLPAVITVVGGAGGSGVPSKPQLEGSLQITDDDLPKEMFPPSPEDVKKLSTRIKALGQEARLMQGYIEGLTQCPWRQASLGKLEGIVKDLENAKMNNKISELIKPKET